MAKPAVAIAYEKAKIRNFLRDGEQDLDAGRWITHDQLVSEIRNRRAKRQST